MENKTTHKNSLPKIVGNNLKMMRNNKKLTQDDLAFEMDSHRELISRIERGNANVSLDTLEKLAYALKVEPIDFFK